MRKPTLMLLALMATLLLLPGYATADGHSYQWLTDDDGDGIPNCEDPDYLPPEDGSGEKYQHGNPVVTLFLSLFNPIDGDQDQIRLRLKDGSCGD